MWLLLQTVIVPWHFFFLINYILNEGNVKFFSWYEERSSEKSDSHGKIHGKRESKRGQEKYLNEMTKGHVKKKGKKKL